jgi:lysophospholipase L1-like esterase
MKQRGPLLAAALSLVLSIVTAVPASAVSYPGSIAATGDSITRAFNTGLLPLTDNIAASWSTGTDGRVLSHYQRLRVLNPEITGRVYNDAKSGAKMRDLDDQMLIAANQRVRYVTVLMGANDVCTATEAGMTSRADFRAQFTAAMSVITSRMPRARIFVASIPDVYRLWQLFKDDFVARAVWATVDICQSMLANAGSDDPADVARRDRVRARNIAFNNILADVCGQFARCRYDNGAVFNTNFTRNDVSTVDYFHPSIAGEAHLAAVTWAASFWGTP